MAKRRGRRTRGNGVMASSQNELGSIIPDAALDRRAEATGLARNDKRLTTVDAASALGILLQRGILTMQHYDAGQMLARAHRRWASSALAKPRTAKVAGIFGPDDKPEPREVEAEEWVKIKERWDGAKAAVPRGLCWALVECVVLDNEVPPRVLERSELAETLKTELLRGMRSLCEYFNIALPEAA